MYSTIIVYWEWFKKDADCRNSQRNNSLKSLLPLMTSMVTKRSDDFLERFEVLSSVLPLTKNCNKLSIKRVSWLERNAVANAQYHHRESVKLNPLSLHQSVMMSLQWKYTKHFLWLVMKLRQATYKLTTI